MSDTQGAQLDPSMNVGLTGGAFINPAYSTPAQRAQLYAYANELMKPREVKTGWQGLAEIARALVGGYEGHQADISEQASRHLDADQAAAVAGKAFSPPSQAGEAPSMPTTPPAGPSEAPSPSADNGPIPNAVSAYVAQSAAQRGIDPAVATKVFGTESGFNPAIPGDGNSSFGVAQLHYGGISKDAPHPGLGDAFTAATGLDARDPKTWKQQVDFALDQAKEHGWQPWATTRDKLGIGNFTGIGKGQPAAPASNATGLGAASPNAGPLASAAAIPAPTSLGGGASAFAPPPASPAPAPAVQAIGAALAARKPAQVAQNAPNGLPVSAQAIGEFLANPNIDPGVKHQAMEVLAPKIYQSATGQVLPSFQNQPVAPPIANLGVLREQGTGTVPAVLGGTPAAPSNIVAPPSVAGAPAPQAGLPAASETAASAADKIFGPDSILGGMKTAAAATDAKAAALKGAGDVSTEQYTHDLKAAADYQRTSLPLTKAIPLLEQLGTTGTGPGTDTWNHAMSLLQSMGIPISDPNNIKAFDEVKKYLTDNVNQNGNLGTNDKLAAAFAGNPSVEVSNAAAADVAKTALSMQRFKQAQILSFGSQKDASGSTLGPEKYAEYAKKFAGDYDPRAFGIDMMSPAARKALDAEMPVGSDARKKFNASLKIALETGMISR